MKRLLVVDDDRAIRESLRDFFEDAGYQVEEASNGQQALSCIQQSHFPQVVLLDVMMPLLDGVGVLDALFAQPGLLRNRRIILMSAGNETFPLRTTQQMSQYGIRFIRKPFDLVVLEALVDAIAATL
jgi:CheY-like chemotaxis protein